MVDKNDRVARLVLGVHALKKKQYRRRAPELAQSVRGPITDLTATLLAGLEQLWRRRHQGRARDDRPSCGPDWYAIFKDLHAGMIDEFSGNQKEAGKRFEAAYKLDPTALRVVAGLRQLGLAQSFAQGRRSRFSRTSTSSCRAIR